MSERGLLNKAEHMRAGAAKNGTDGWEMQFDKKSGISMEDQKDILRHIDRVAQSSRILAGPDTWKVRPRKRGLAAPLLVNLFAALVLVVGLYGLWRVFSTTEKRETVAKSSIQTAEGRLLQEIRREAEGRIREKDREIVAIQEKLSALDSEKTRLLSSVEERIKAKETELRQQLSEELEKERQRLIAAGLTASTVEERIKAFEQEKTEAMKRELDTFSRKAEEERLALQADLDKARAEYRQNLSDITSERQKILDDSRKREQELRSQLDAKERALEEEKSRTTERLRDAQAELALMNEEATKAQAAEDRLLGLFASTRGALQEGDLTRAAEGAASIRQYLSEPSVSGLSGLSRRRDSDLFIADLVDRAVEEDRSRSSADTLRITDALAVLGRIREDASKARTSLAGGDRAGAESAYRRVLSAMPELEAARDFLYSQAAAKDDEARAARDSEADAAYTAMTNAYAARDWAGVDAAAEKLLFSLSLGEERTSDAVRRIKESGSALTLASRRSTDSAAAEQPLREASARMEEGRFSEAIAAYAGVLARYPEARQIPQAREGLERGVRQLSTSFQQYRESAQSKTASLEAKIAELESSGNAQEGGSSADLGAVDSGAWEAEKARLEASLAESEQRYAAIRSAYDAFVQDETAINSSGGAQALIEGRSRMDAFFTNDAVEATLPGMRDRLARYLTAYERAGEKEVLLNAQDIVEGATRIRDAAVRERYFKEMEERYADNSSMLEFLKTLRSILK